MRHFILLILAAVIAPAQIVSFGVKAGVPVTDALPSQYQSNSSIVDTGRWTVGPTVELHFHRGFSLEFDALYRGYRYVSSSVFSAIFAGASDSQTTLPLSSSFRADTRAWDLPLLLKYRFKAARVRPFLDAGISFTHESDDVTSSIICLGNATDCNASNLYQFLGSHDSSYSRWRGGYVGGVGVEFKYGRIKIAPEVRYDRITQSPNRNNMSVIVGFTF